MLVAALRPVINVRLIFLLCSIEQQNSFFRSSAKFLGPLLVEKLAEPNRTDKEVSGFRRFVPLDES